VLKGDRSLCRADYINLLLLCSPEKIINKILSSFSTTISGRAYVSGRGKDPMPPHFGEK